MACLFGHKWDGCKCTKCSKFRDVGHQWDGCKCSKCGKIRNKEHQWDGCKCTICNEIRSIRHDFQETEHSCTQQCRICGQKKELHEMENNKCSKCGNRFIPRSFFNSDEHDTIIKAIGIKRLFAKGNEEIELTEMMDDFLADKNYIPSKWMVSCVYGPLQALREQYPLCSPPRLAIDALQKKILRIIEN